MTAAMAAALDVVCRRTAATVTVWLLISSADPSAALAQQTTLQDESRLVEWAARLDAADRPDEALSVLEGLLDRQPISRPGLALLLEVASRRDRVAPFLPRFALAGRNDAASGSLRRLWIDALLAAGLADSARSVAQGWAEARPDEAGAYLALASVEVASGDAEAGAEVLRRGRRRLDGASVFAVELGTMSLQIGDYEAAADEWLRLAQAGGDASVLEEVVGGDPDLRDAFVSAVAAALSGMPPAAAVAASYLMLRFGAHERAGELARDLEGDLPATGRVEFLVRFAEEARASGAHDQGAWAAERLADLIADPVRRDRWRAAAAEMALQAGDTARARRAFDRLLRNVAAGTGVHRVSSRQLFSLTLADPDSAERLLADFQRAYPRPESELVQMRIELARSFVRADRLVDAERILVTGIPIAPTGDSVPPARLALELGHVRLYAGDGSGAIEALEVATSATDSDVGTRTSAIRLAGALSSSDSASARRFGHLLHMIARRPTPAELATGLRGWESGDTSPETMELAASALDDAGFRARAAELRARLIDRYPLSPESPVALLAIARYERGLQHAGSADSSPVSRLERLILEYPQSAVTPLARRLRAEWLAASPPKAEGG